MTTTGIIGHHKIKCINFMATTGEPWGHDRIKCINKQNKIGLIKLLKTFH